MTQHTHNGIAYKEVLAEPQGMMFTLNPVKGKCTNKDILMAKSELYHSRDVVGSIKIQWR